MSRKISSILVQAYNKRKKLKVCFTMDKPQWSIVLVILLTAATAFFSGQLFGMDLPAFLYIVIVAFGLFLHTIILVVTSDGEKEYEETHLKGRSK